MRFYTNGYERGFFRQIINSWFSHEVTKTQTNELLILLSFYFHEVLEQLKLNYLKQFFSKRIEMNSI